MRLVKLSILIVLLVVTFAGCRKARETASGAGPVDPCSIALTRQSGAGVAEISLLQEAVRNGAEPSKALEKLGWKYVELARTSYDPGYYKLAEQCALCLESKGAQPAQAILLRGHALQSLHRFKEAEALARELVSKRGLWSDYGLLGDALTDQGRLAEGIDAYQRMVDLKPGLQSYTRAAHVRWLKGDVEGARELMLMAARAGSPQESEATAWAYSRVALYELQAGDTKAALGACQAAVEYQPDYAPALLARGRVLLAKMDNAGAVESLKRAAALDPLPEYQWTLADALRAAGRVEEAQAVEADIVLRGDAPDPRTFALYLATRNERSDELVALAERELQTRADVFTLDALAWSLAAAGRYTEAGDRIKQALAEGTKDARLFYHAGVIAGRSGQKTEARRWLVKAAALGQMLLPSEREQLAAQLRKQ